MTNLKAYKTKKKYEKIISDIDAILLVFDLSVRSLIHFKNYVVCQEIISIITTNASILKMQQLKMKKELDLMKEEEDAKD